MSDKKRQEQLKSALRANLRKRKEQARAREQGGANDAAPSDLKVEARSTLSEREKPV